MPIDARRPSVRPLFTLSAGLAIACGSGGGDAPTGGGPAIAEVRLTQRAVTLTSLNDSVRLVAGAYDERNSSVAGVTFSWRSLTPAVASVLDANGLVRAQANGVSKVVVTGGGKSDTATVTVQQQTNSVLPSVANASLEVGDTLYLTAVLRDARGTTIAGRSVAWTSENESIVTVSAAGMVVARAIGSANVVAAGDGRTATIPIAVAGSVGPFIDAVSPDTIVPGATLTITGRELTAGGVPTVTIAGVAAGIASSSPTQIVLQAPSAPALGCTPTQRAALAVTTGPRTRTRLHPMKTAVRRTLAVGESITMLDAASVLCNELVGAGRYIMSVFNTSAALSSTTGLRVRGAVATTNAAISFSSSSLAQRVVPASVVPGTRVDDALLSADREHFRRLEWTRRIVREAGSPLRQWERVRRERAAGRPAGAPSLSLSAATRAVGDTLTLRYHYASCSEFTPVRARVVYSGSRSIVLEDVTAPRANSADAELIAMGREFDAVQFPILARDFGDPLRLDATLNGDGRIFMLFTPLVGQTPALAFVSPCDFYPVSTFAASNEAEIFYARPAASTDSINRWRFGMRSTLIHEVKHITAAAERLARYGLANPILEESWLEEGLARIAEEQYSRTFTNGGSWKGNAGFAGMECELRWCDSRPYMMTRHFNALYTNFLHSDSLTFLGPVPVDADASFYGSAWSLARWAIDHFATDEAAFIRALVNGPETGVSNITARTGLAYPQIVSDYSLAMFLDDLPGFTPSRSVLRFPSWNLRAVMGGMNAINPYIDGNPWALAFPLLARMSPNGNFTSDVSSLRSGRAAFFDVTIAGNGVPQMLELQSATGGPPASNIRVTFVRVQ